MNNVITNANGVKVKVRVYDIGDGEKRVIKYQKQEEEVCQNTTGTL